VAGAKASSGKRCRKTVETSRITHWTEVSIPNVGTVSTYDLGGDLLHGDFYDKERWLAQRCATHWPEAEPEWVLFDLAGHDDLVTRHGTRRLV
jgi:hypothetical protein